MYRTIILTLRPLTMPNSPTYDPTLLDQSLAASLPPSFFNSRAAAINSRARARPPANWTAVTALETKGWTGITAYMASKRAWGPSLYWRSSPPHRIPDFMSQPRWCAIRDCVPHTYIQDEALEAGMMAAYKAAGGCSPRDDYDEFRLRCAWALIEDGLPRRQQAEGEIDTDCPLPFERVHERRGHERRGFEGGRVKQCWFCRWKKRGERSMQSGKLTASECGDCGLPLCVDCWGEFHCVDDPVSCEHRGGGMMDNTMN